MSITDSNGIFRTGFPGHMKTGCDRFDVQAIFNGYDDDNITIKPGKSAIETFKIVPYIKLQGQSSQS